MTEHHIPEGHVHRRQREIVPEGSRLVAILVGCALVTAVLVLAHFTGGRP